MQQQTIELLREQIELQRQQLHASQYVPPPTAVPASPTFGGTRREDFLTRAARFSPPTFHGERDPAVLEEWFAEFEKLFAAMRCPETHQSDVAAYFLKGAADIWWRGVRQELEDGEYFTWREMRRRMIEEYFPTIAESDLRREFSRLEQGDMTVTEYYTKFRALMRYEPSAAADMRSTIAKFEDGCDGAVGHVFGNGRSRSLAHAYDRAAYVERANTRRAERVAAREAEERAARRERSPRGDRRRHRPGDQTRRRQDGRRDGVVQTFVQGDQTDRHGGQPWDRCTLCHRSHPGTTCTRPPLTCYGCGQPGHTRRYCPSQAGVGATAPPTRGLPPTAVVTAGQSRVPPPTGRLTVISASEAARCSDVTGTFLSLSFRCDYVITCLYV